MMIRHSILRATSLRRISALNVRWNSSSSSNNYGGGGNRAKFRNAKQLIKESTTQESSSDKRKGDVNGDLIIQNSEMAKSEEEIGKALRNVADRARDEVFGNFDILSNSQRPQRTISYFDCSNNNTGEYGTIVLNDGTRINNNNMVILWDNECYIIPLPEKQQRKNHHDDDDDLESKSKSPFKDAYFKFPQELIDLFKIIFPKPDLLVLGTGIKTRMIHSNSLLNLTNLGISVDTANSISAAGNFDLLATERNGRVAICLCPPLY